MKLRIFVLISVCYALIGASPQVAKGNLSFKKLDIRASPSKDEWRFFGNMSESFREKLWVDFAKAGRGLKDWSWEWRIAWIRNCERDSGKFCLNILKAGIDDQALVVRSQAAKSIGEKFQGSESKEWIQLLVKNFSSHLNEHKKKPLFIQQNILYALFKIGGEGIETAAMLSKKYPSTHTYWKKLNHL